MNKMQIDNAMKAKMNAYEHHNIIVSLFQNFWPPALSIILYPAIPTSVRMIDTNKSLQWKPSRKPKIKHNTKVAMNGQVELMISSKVKGAVIVMTCPFFSFDEPVKLLTLGKLQGERLYQLVSYRECYSFCFFKKFHLFVRDIGKSEVAHTLEAVFDVFYTLE